MIQEKQHVVQVTTIYTFDSSMEERTRNCAAYEVRQSGRQASLTRHRPMRIATYTA